MIKYTIVFLVTQFLELLIALKLVGVFYEKRKTSFRIMLSLILFIYFVISFLHFFIRDHLSLYLVIPQIFMAFVWYFIITFNYESTIVKRIVVSVSVFTILSVSDVIASLSIWALFPKIALHSNDFLLLMSIAEIPIGYLLATLLSRFKSIKKSSIAPRITLVIPITVVLMLLVFIFLQIATVSGMDIVEEAAAILASVLFAAPIFLIFYLYDILSEAYESKLKEALHAQEKEYYFTQCQLMQETVENAKSIRHDMKSQLATLKDYSIKGRLEDITSYLDNLLEVIERSEIYSDTGNIAFDSIINYKLRGALKDNILLDLSMFIPPVINVEVSDIVTILGNLLDNALEAVAKVDEKIIKLDIEYGRGGLFIKIENSFNGEIKYLEDRNGEEKHLASLKIGDEHGYGLKNIKKSIEKYNGYIQLTHYDNSFSAVVFLYVDCR